MIRRRATGTATPRMAEAVDPHSVPEPCDCGGAGLPLLADICPDTQDATGVMLLRFVFAAYCHDKTQCIDAGMNVAAELFGEEAAANVIARMMGLVRALRAERQGNFLFLPGHCARISEDEMELAEALKAARGADKPALDLAVSLLARRSSAPRIMRSLWGLAVTLDCLNDQMNPAAPRSSRPTNLH